MKNHVNCGGCKKAKATLRSVGGDNMKSLFDHVGWVMDTDTIEEALTKVADSIQQQVRLHLFQQIPQGGYCFTEWYVKFKEQAERCV